jgi:hypothetical protein
MNAVLLSTRAILGFEITGIKGLDEVLFVIIAGWACVFIALFIIKVFIEWAGDTALDKLSKSFRYAGYKQHGGPTAKEKEQEKSWAKLPSTFQFRLIGWAVGLIFVVVSISCRK